MVRKRPESRPGSLARNTKGSPLTKAYATQAAPLAAMMGKGTGFKDCSIRESSYQGALVGAWVHGRPACATDQGAWRVDEQSRPGATSGRGGYEVGKRGVADAPLCCCLSEPVLPRGWGCRKDRWI